MEVQPSHPTSTVHSITDARTSEYLNATILGNDDASKRVHEISINYAETRESFDRKTTITDSYFSAMIAEILGNDQIQRPWQSAKRTRTGTNGRMQSKQKYPCSQNVKYSHK